MRPCPARPRHFPYTTLFRSTSTMRKAAHILNIQIREASAPDLSNQPRRGGTSLAQGVSPGYQADKNQSPIGAAPARQLLLYPRSEEHTSEFQSLAYLVCRLL